MSNLAIRSFSSGELAPALYARTDLAKYEVGLRTCRNMIVMRQGGATKRPGFEYICAVKEATQKVRQIPFVFNVRDTLVLEFGDFYIRFVQNAGIVLDPIDHTIPYEIASPYAVADLSTLQFVQSADVVTIVHPNYPPYELKRLSNTHWTVAPVAFGSSVAAPVIVAAGGDVSITRDASYVITAVSSSGEESLVSNISTTANPPGAAVGQSVFVSGLATGAETYNVYRQDADSGVFGYIGSGIGATVSYFDFGALPDNTHQPPVVRTPFASPGNYPSVVAYYQQRLLFANSINAPDTVWASRTGFYHNFNVSVISQDDDAITFRLVSDEIDAIRHIVNLSRLVIMTEGAEWLVEGDGNGVLTPASVNARIGSVNGVAGIRPIKADNRMLYVQALGSGIRDLQSDVQFGSYSLVGADVTIYSSHLVDGFSITDWAWQQTPMRLVWAVRSDGVLVSLTYIPEQQMLAWHRHDTPGFIENVAVVPEGRSHWVYVVVKRLINGTYRRYIERMTTANVLPVFATPEDAARAPGGIITPPPPPPPPPPSPTSISPPTNASTTDVGTTGATANWVAGATVAATSIEIRRQGQSDSAWVATAISGAYVSYRFNGLASGTAYEWRVAHFIGSVFSNYLGPSAATQFTTLAVTETLVAPASAPILINTIHNSGSTDITISWPAPSITGETSTLQIAGPTDLTPTDGEFSDIGSFVTGAGTALWTLLHHGTYWLRVRYEKTGFDPSAWAGPSDWVITITDET